MALSNGDVFLCGEMKVQESFSMHSKSCLAQAPQLSSQMREAPLFVLSSSAMPVLRLGQWKTKPGGINDPTEFPKMTICVDTIPTFSIPHFN
jgi:hypothetical protein